MTPNDASGITADEALIEKLRSHGEREGGALAAYRSLADRSEDEGLRYLVDLIMQDEVRHHEQIDRMLANLRSFVWDVDIESRVPDVHPSEDVIAETGRLLKIEQQDAKDLREIKRELRHRDVYPLLPLLVDLMLHDTAKHVDILEFIRFYAQRHRL